MYLFLVELCSSLNIIMIFWKIHQSLQEYLDKTTNYNNIAMNKLFAIILFRNTLWGKNLILEILEKNRLSIIKDIPMWKDIYSAYQRYFNLDNLLIYRNIKNISCWQINVLFMGMRKVKISWKLNCTRSILFISMINI